MNWGDLFNAILTVGSTLFKVAIFYVMFYVIANSVLLSYYETLIFSFFGLCYMFRDVFLLEVEAGE